MRELKCDPNVEIIGASVISVTDNMQIEEVQPYLKRHGLEHVEVDKWYPAQSWLSVMNDLRAQTNFTQNAVAIGLAVAENVWMPPEMQNASMEDIVLQWGNIYDMQHRGGDIGFIKTEKLGPKHIRTTHQHPYPDELTYGIGYGFCRRFAKGESFTVQYLDMDYRMDKGDAPQTIIDITWE